MLDQKPTLDYAGHQPTPLKSGMRGKLTAILIASVLLVAALCAVQHFFSP